MITSDLATLDAVLNAVSAVLLTVGRIQIKRGNPVWHKRFMLAALVSSALFLTSYLIYHSRAGTVPYQRHDWTRPIYFAVLIPHIILAAGMVPFVILAVWHALHERFQKHTRITRWLWWVWMYVSFSGVMVYLMLYHL